MENEWGFHRGLDVQFVPPFGEVYSAGCNLARLGGMLVNVTRTLKPLLVNAADWAPDREVRMVEGLLVRFSTAYETLQKTANPVITDLIAARRGRVCRCGSWSGACTVTLLLDAAYRLWVNKLSLLVRVAGDFPTAADIAPTLPRLWGEWQKYQSGAGVKPPSWPSYEPIHTDLLAECVAASRRFGGDDVATATQIRHPAPRRTRPPADWELRIYDLMTGAGGSDRLSDEALARAVKAGEYPDLKNAIAADLKANPKKTRKSGAGQKRTPVNAIAAAYGRVMKWKARHKTL